MVSTKARENEKTINIKKLNHLGLVFEPSLNLEHYSSQIGLQYKRWVNPNSAIRVSASRGTYSSSTSNSIYEIKNDTAYYVQKFTNIPMYTASLGVEYQKQLYKIIYLYGAADVSVTHGTGYTSEIHSKTYFDTDGNKNHGYIDGPIKNSSSRRTAIYTMPSVGFKLLFKRISAGMEIATLQIGTTQVSSSKLYKNSYTIFDIDYRHFRQRFFLNYRF